MDNDVRLCRLLLKVSFKYIYISIYILKSWYQPLKCLGRSEKLAQDTTSSYLQQNLTGLTTCLWNFVKSSVTLLDLTFTCASVFTSVILWDFKIVMFSQLYWNTVSEKKKRTRRNIGNIYSTKTSLLWGILHPVLGHGAEW